MSKITKEQLKQFAKINTSQILSSIQQANRCIDNFEPIHLFYIGNDHNIPKRLSKTSYEQYKNKIHNKNFLNPQQFLDQLIEKIGFKLGEKNKLIDKIRAFFSNFKIDAIKAIDAAQANLRDYIKPYDFARNLLEKLANSTFENNKVQLQQELDAACEFFAFANIDTQNFYKLFEQKIKKIQDNFKIQLHEIAQDLLFTTADILNIDQGLDIEKELQNYKKKTNEDLANVIKELIKRNELLNVRIKEIEIEKSVLEKKIILLEKQPKKSAKSLSNEFECIKLKPRETLFNKSSHAFTNLLGEFQQRAKDMEIMCQEINDFKNKNKISAQNNLKASKNLPSLNRISNPIIIEDFQNCKSINNLSAQIIDKSTTFRPKFTGNPTEDCILLESVSKKLKSNDKIYLNFNLYKIELSNDKLLQGLVYDKKGLIKMISITKELARKVQELIFNYTNNELQLECVHFKNLLSLEKQYSHHTFLYYNYTINFEKNFNKLHTQISLLNEKHRLYLHFNVWNSNFGNQEAGQIATALKSLKFLSKLHLDLRGNNIEKEGAIQIAQALQNCNFISNLFLGFGKNNIQQEGATQIARALQKLINISSLELHLWQTLIGSEAVVEISEALKTLPNVSHLVLGLANTNMGNIGAKAIASTLPTLENSSTLILWLSDNNIGDDGAIVIADNLKCLKNLSHLDLQINHNNIGDQGAKEIATALHSLKGLSSLVLWLRPNKYTQDSKRYFEGLKGSIHLQKM